MAKKPNALPLFPILNQENDCPSAPPPGIARLAAGAPVIDEGHRVEFRALPVRSMLNRTQSRRGWNFTRSINPYRGCEFGCHYCYARYTHEFMELREPHAFETQIYIKQNAAWLLRQELHELRPGDSIAIGTATDPYQPIERTACVTRSLLQVLAGQQDLRINLVTKSGLVTRDIDLLQQIAIRNRVTINLTITTLDTHLARILEPRAPRPDLRLHALRRLRQAGIRAGVLCCPLLPGITDTSAALDSVARAAKEADACFFHANPLFLKPCSKPVFEEFIQQNFPALLRAYRERFQDHAFVGPAYRRRIVELVDAVRKKYGWDGLRSDGTPAFEDARASAQLQLGYSRSPHACSSQPPSADA